MEYKENETTIWAEFSKSDFKGREYPFKADKIILRNMYKYCIAVDIKGKTYALNGSMQNHIKGMKTPFEDNLIIKNKSVSDAIAIGLEMWGDKELVHKASIKENKSKYGFIKKLLNK